MDDRKRASEKKRKYSKCSTCNGTGDYGANASGLCPRCKGKGYIEVKSER